MTILRRNLFRLWILCSLLWLMFFLKEVINSHFNHIGDAVVAFLLFLLPPIICFFAAWGLARVWERFGEAYWLRLPEHLRRGLTRLYLVVALPWVAWYVYQIYDALQRHRYGPSRDLSHAFWSMLIVPIGFPIVAFAALWVIAGFREREPASGTDAHVRPMPWGQRPPKPTMRVEQPGEQWSSFTLATNAPASAPNPGEPIPRSSRESPETTHYYTIINDAVSQLEDKSKRARQVVYVKARTVLADKLQGHSRRDIKREWNALEKAIREVEAEARRLSKPASTAFLVISMLLFPIFWIIDASSMSLYGVARLRKSSK